MNLMFHYNSSLEPQHGTERFKLMMVFWQCLEDKMSLLTQITKSLFLQAGRQTIIYKYCDSFDFSTRNSHNAEGQSFTQIVFSPILLDFDFASILKDSWKSETGCLCYQPTIKFREEIPNEIHGELRTMFE